MPATDITPATRPSDPLQILVDCITVATLRGIRVTADPYPGVVLASTHVPSWERDPRSETVSALGAVLLVKQPAIGDLDAALEKALGVSPGWILGFERGVLHMDLDDRLQRRPDGRLVGQGFIAGQEIRARLHIRHLGPPLKLGVPVTGPARGLIAHLIDTLTLSQLDEAAADSCRRRAEGLPAEVAERLAVAEERYRELALEHEGLGV
jgi:hypothetical protein